jgi:mitochondrial fission protein ELM1
MQVAGIEPETVASRIAGPSSPRLVGCRQISDCWGLSEGAAGMVSQLKGVAAAVGWPARFGSVQLRQPWKLLWPGFIPSAGIVYRDDWFLKESPPRLLITCGRQAVPASLILKKLYGRRIFTVHIQDPKLKPEHFDLLVAPAHDGLTGSNVVSTLGAVHHITQELLAEAAAGGLPRALAGLRQPFVMVLLGGPTRHYGFDGADMRRLADKIERMISAEGVGAAILPSRRTPEHAVQQFVDRFGQSQYVWRRHEENPYLAALAFASHIVVTCDSVSMLTEAAGTGRPVFVEHLAECRPARRFRELHQSFEQAGISRPFEGRLAHWSYRPRNESAEVARILLERMESLKCPF